MFRRCDRGEARWGTPSTHRGTYPDDPDDAVAVEHGERVLGGPAEGGGALGALLEPAEVLRVLTAVLRVLPSTPRSSE
jgi:hypothetical protein